MRFGPVPVTMAAGAILVHSIGGFRKGRILSSEDCAALAGQGFTEVTVAIPAPGDLGEDAAAAALAAALVRDPEGQGLRLGPAVTGRVNIYATGPGIIRVDAEKVAALNRADPMITLATVREWQRVEAGTMVATVKIIAYAVPAAGLARAVAAAGGALRRLPPQPRTATLIETVIPGRDPGPKGRRAVAARLNRLGVTLGPVVEVAHETGAIAGALAAARGDLLLILTASATSDIADVGPAAVVTAGGRIERFGMPVDPGNLLFLGALGARPVIGLPGCARSPALNGADWVMERVICGVPPDHDAIAAMGVGGLLKEIPSRPRPRESSIPTESEIVSDFSTVAGDDEKSPVTE